MRALGRLYYLKDIIALFALFVNRYCKISKNFTKKGAKFLKFCKIGIVKS